MRILVLAAMEQEADGFLPGANATSGSSWPAIRTATLSGHSLHIAVTGVGTANASGAAALLCERYGPDLMLMIGTAGKIAAVEGDCFWLSRAIQHDYGRRSPQGFVHYDPGAIPFGPSIVTPFESVADPGIGLPNATIVSGDSFVEDPVFSAHLAATLGAQLVDMETAAVAHVAGRLGVPWAAIKATTDEADHDSTADFWTNLRHASRRAGEAVERFVAML